MNVVIILIEATTFLTSTVLVYGLRILDDVSFAIGLGKSLTFCLHHLCISLAFSLVLRTSNDSKTIANTNNLLARFL